MVMRSDGAGRPFAPRALAGMIVGAAMAVAVVAIKRRREILETDREVFMKLIVPRWQSPREQKNASVLRSRRMLLSFSQPTQHLPDVECASDSDVNRHGGVPNQGDNRQQQPEPMFSHD